MSDENFQKILQYALKLLSFRPRSESEITIKLKFFAKKKGISKNTIEKVLKDLKSQNLINDEEFAKWWIMERRKEKPKGIKAIRYELFQKGIKKEIIENLLDDEKDQLEIDYQTAGKIVRKKIDLYKGLSPYKQKMKLSQLLYRKGYTWHTISKVIDSFVQKN